MKKNLIIKILSLGIGLAAGIVLVAKVCFELSFDRNFKDADRIYKIMTGFTQSGQYDDFGQVSGAIAPGMMREVPGVEYGTRVTFFFDSDRYRFVDQGDDSFIKGELVLADTWFFKVFGGTTENFTISIADQSQNLPVLSYGASTTQFTDLNTTYSTTLKNK
ncbi:MAG: hypothetical protein II637_06455, partial [Bacteroidales bacterium]|nr:hypothetical protein [Bacteroidales bacterium]